MEPSLKRVMFAEADAIDACPDLAAAFELLLRWQRELGGLVIVLPDWQRGLRELLLWRSLALAHDHVAGELSRDVLIVSLVRGDRVDVRAGGKRLPEGALAALWAISARTLRHRWGGRRAQVVLRLTARREVEAVVGALQAAVLEGSPALLAQAERLEPELWLTVGTLWEFLGRREEARAAYLRQRGRSGPGGARMAAATRLVRLLVRARQDLEALRVIEAAFADRYRDYVALGFLEAAKAGICRRLGLAADAAAAERSAWLRARASLQPALVARVFVTRSWSALRSGDVATLLSLPLVASAQLVTAPLFRERALEVARWSNALGRPPRLSPERPVDPGGVRRLAVVRLDRLGDLVCSLPALAAIRTRFPGAHITAYVTAGLEDVVTLAGCSDRVVGVPWSRRDDFAAVRHALAAESFDLVVDLLELERSWELELGRVFSSPELLGFDTRTRRTWMPRRARLPRDRTHLVDQVHGLLRPLGVATPSERLLPMLPRTAELVTRGEALLGAGRARPCIGIHVGSGYRFRSWSADRFAMVARRLAREHGADVVLLAGRDEEVVAENVLRAASVGRRVTTASVVELAAVMTGLDLMISMDTGPMHLAGALGVSLVVLWGPGSFEIFGPRWPTARVINHWAPCAGCPQEGSPRRCSAGYLPDETPCMSTITVDEVMAEVAVALAARGSATGPIEQ